MSEFLGSALWLIISLGVLISFHEFGHFWVARRLGVKVLRFSIGIGRPLWIKRGKDGTEYVIAALPLGGYVRMLDEREDEVQPEELHLAFNRKPVLSRIAIVAAGPIFNLILTVIAFWVMYMVGIADMRAALGELDGLAAEAGLHQDAVIEQVDGRPIETWSDLFQTLVIPAVQRRDVEVVENHPDFGLSTHTLELSRLPPEFHESKLLDFTGLSVWRPPLAAVVSEVRADMPAAAAGLVSGDRILSINGEHVEDWYDVTRLISAHGADLRPMSMTWAHQGITRSGTLTPILDNGRPVLGIVPMQPDEAVMEQWRSYQVIQRYTPWPAVQKSFQYMGRLTVDTLSMLKQLVLGRASLDNLSGPITIARIANDSASLGLARFLAFLGLISLSLGILNLLPIPILDGGHLVYYFIELVKGSPVPDKFQLAGQYVGILMLASLMGLAIFNDILRLFA